MSHELETYGFSDFLRQQPSVRSSTSSASTGVSPWGSLSTPATTPPVSERQLSTRSVSDITTTIPLNDTVLLTFVKGSKLFKLRYTQVDVCRDASGALRCVELSDPAALSGVFIHSIARNKQPIPHLEEPVTSNTGSFRVSFLETQTVQIAQTVFETQPQYTFEQRDDCVRFQQEILGLTLLLAAGVAEISSKGRGEEAISQNVRICRSATGATNILFFPNSQRKELKRYVRLFLDSIDKIEQPKKSSKPIHLKLNANTDLTAQMKDLSVLFIDRDHATRFVTILQGAGVKVSSK